MAIGIPGLTQVVIPAEITLINEVFSDYGFSFMDLAQCSPKSRKTKKACAKAVAYLIKTPILTSEIKIKKQLPLNIIEKNPVEPVNEEFKGWIYV
jgi:RNA polymerase sigma factor